MNVLANKPPVALRSIALFEIIKGALALAGAFGLLSLRRTDLHASADAFLYRCNINPETHYTRLLIETIAKAANHHLGQIVGLCFGYALIRFLEGYGLWRCKRWAEWFAILSAGIYLPLEIRHLFHHPTAISVGVILLNIAIIVYLWRLLVAQREKRQPASAPVPKPVRKEKRAEMLPESNPSCAIRPKLDCARQEFAPGGRL